MKAHGLNAVSVQEPWKLVKETDGAVPIWREEASRLTSEGSNLSPLHALVTNVAIHLIGQFIWLESIFFENVSGFLTWITT